jgi:hypothetical protein
MKFWCGVRGRNFKRRRSGPTHVDLDRLDGASPGDDRLDGASPGDRPLNYLSQGPL